MAQKTLGPLKLFNSTLTVLNQWLLYILFYVCICHLNPSLYDQQQIIFIPINVASENAFEITLKGKNARRPWGRKRGEKAKHEHNTSCSTVTCSPKLLTSISFWLSSVDHWCHFFFSLALDISLAPTHRLKGKFLFSGEKSNHHPRVSTEPPTPSFAPVFPTFPKGGFRLANYLLALPRAT